MRLWHTILGTALAAACAFGQSEAAVGTKQPQFTMDINAVQSPVKSGSDVRVTISLTNTSTHEIRVLRSKYDDGRPYKIEVLDDAGQPARLTKYGRQVLKDEGGPFQIVGGGGHITLKPGVIMRDTMLLSDLFDLRPPGKYTVQLQRPDDAGTSVKSNTITITVTE